VPVAQEVFDRLMPQPNQIDRKREDVQVSAADLLRVPEGTITEQGLRTNVSVGIQYIESWLRGQGAAPLYNLMEDAATAEISRAQVWQWIRHPRGVLADGRKVTLVLYQQVRDEEMAKLREQLGAEEWSRRKFDPAIKLYDELTEDEHFVDFLTLPGYALVE
jgi:malate synthase